jgi:GAF domain-containing protein
MTPVQRLTEVFVEVADSLTDDFDIIDLLQRLSERCVELLDVSAAGILLADQFDELQLLAASDENTRLLELFALQHDQGPCIECCRSGRAQTDIDLSTAGARNRWPQFASRAAAAGFVRTQAIPLRLRQRVVGALNLFHERTGNFTSADQALAQALADIATIAILQQRTLHRSQLEHLQVQTALNTRAVVEQAKGILAERWHTTIDDAFTILRNHARTHRSRLTDVAHQVIDQTIDTDTLLHSGDVALVTAGFAPRRTSSPEPGPCPVASRSENN